MSTSPVRHGTGMYRALKPEAIVSTCERLATRIAERFPASGLSKVARELLELARESAARVRELQKPNWPIRAGVAAMSLILLAALLGLATSIRPVGGGLELIDVLQGVESAVNDIVFLGIGIFFLVTLERRFKRRSALRSLHELRSVAHVIDMHQLTKDPEQLLSPAMATASSPERTMTRFELARYLDYSSELLSITSKVAALYVQHLDDPQVHSTVDGIQSLTGNLSSKIWQKIVIIDTVAARQGE